MSRRRYSNYWGYFPPSRPIPVEDGIKARTKRGQFGKNWWARRWIAVLQTFGWSNRLQRGRTYARKGQVMNIDVRVGRVNARVQGSRRKPYSVRIEIAPLDDDQWEQAIEAMAVGAVPICSRFKPYMDLADAGAPIVIISEDTPAGWYEAMQKLIRYEDRREWMKSKGIAWVENNRDMSRSGHKEWAAFYESTVNAMD